MKLLKVERWNMPNTDINDEEYDTATIWYPNVRIFAASTTSEILFTIRQNKGMYLRSAY